MVVFINGSFGVGKTTVARLLVRQLPHSGLFDPEPFGVVLLHLSAHWPPTARVDDFQDLRLWRTASVRLIRAARGLRRTVVVPMTFSNETYLGEFLSGARRHDADTRHFCLTAPLDVVRERLGRREGRRGPSAWLLRRSAECCVAHSRPEFAEHVATENRTPQAVADEILARLRER